MEHFEKAHRSQRRLTPVTVKLPLRVDTVSRLLSDGSNTLVLYVEPPRAVWSILHPLLFHNSPQFARRATWLLLYLFASKQEKKLEIHNGREKKLGSAAEQFVKGFDLAEMSSKKEMESNKQKKEDQDENVICRTVHLLFTSVTLQRRNACLIIQPKATVAFDSSLEQRLIHFENQLIRAQSMAGFLSTLGGGFFMCHHWKTAVAMAQQQQHMARILNDSNMYFKCLVNQAYNCIYAGYFMKAEILLQHVLVEVEKERPSEAHILINMVESATVFCNRVRRFANKQSIAASKGKDERRTRHDVITSVFAGQSSQCMHDKNIDDFRRIRVIKDESSADDLLRAFGGRTM
ncbi:hypothetical protein MPSEU_000568400 [Mayamaea pseudoterrestris]|nr:hypothetical protein MPSEU_000568400 [Mayamaea pseudoterrestris]